MAQTTHIAGLDITVEGRHLRQRCAWCGHVLIDEDLTRVMVPEGSESTLPSWPAGRLVTVDGGVSFVHEEGEKLPDDACALVHPELTV